MDAFAEVNAAFPWFFPVVVFIFGAAIGSFLNVCIYRIPAERSIITPGSTCACGKPIAWYDNIPIVSWIILRGRARCCGRPFSVRYPAIELLTAVLFLVCWLQHPPARAAAEMVPIAMLICATFIDFDHMIIPNRFTIGAAVVGVLISIFVPSLHGAVTGDRMLDGLHAGIQSVLGVLIGSGVVLWIGLIGEVVLRKEAMGFGDVKFLGGIGAFIGWKGAIFSIFGGAIIGTLAFAVILLWHGLFGRKKENPSDDAENGESAIAFGKQTPFGPMLAAGALLYVLWLQPWVDAYFNAVAELLRSRY